VATRFANIAAAGEIASSFAVTGWGEGEAMRAAATCFAAWLKNRGGLGNQERRDRLRAVKHFLEAFGDARFPLLSEADNERDGRVLNRAGYRRNHTGAFDMPQDRCDFLISTEVFRNDVCKGLEARMVAQDLAEIGCLEKSPKGEYTQVVRVPSIGTQRFYSVGSAILELEI
jgi:putative DNA primase/helicase